LGAGVIADDEQTWYENPTYNRFTTGKGFAETEWHRTNEFGSHGYSGYMYEALDKYALDQLSAGYRPNIGDVTFASQAFSAGLTGDGYPMWVGQAENGPQSSVAWIVCSCRDVECEQPECHILADSDSVMDPSMRQCVKWEDATNRRNGYRSPDQLYQSQDYTDLDDDKAYAYSTMNSDSYWGIDTTAYYRKELNGPFNNNFKKNPLSIRSGHYSSRHRILNGASRDLPIIVQHISSFCIQITGGQPANDPYRFIMDAYGQLRNFVPTASAFSSNFESASATHSSDEIPSSTYPSSAYPGSSGQSEPFWDVGGAQNWDPKSAIQSRSVYSQSPTNRKVLLQSSKAVYIHCLDATCSEASVSALQNSRLSSVSHESSYNQVESLVIAPDHVLTIFAPDATFNELSYSWSETDSILPRYAAPDFYNRLGDDYNDQFTTVVNQEVVDWKNLYSYSDPVFNVPYATELGTPTYVILQEVLGIHPTPRTAGWKTWLSNRWSSPNGVPCQSSEAGRQISADGVVFLCTGLDLGDDQRWGTSPVAGWTKFWEWKELGWGLRWRWQGDVHLGTDRIMDKLYERIQALSEPFEAFDQPATYYFPYESAPSSSAYQPAPPYFHGSPP
jgi:hypothetical protein